MQLAAELRRCGENATRGAAFQAKRCAFANISPNVFSGVLCCAELRHPFKCCFQLFLAAAQLVDGSNIKVDSPSFLSFASAQQESCFRCLMEANSQQAASKTTDMVGLLLTETLLSALFLPSENECICHIFSCSSFLTAQRSNNTSFSVMLDQTD